MKITKCLLLLCCLAFTSCGSVVFQDSTPPLPPESVSHGRINPKGEEFDKEAVNISFSGKTKRYRSLERIYMDILFSDISNQIWNGTVTIGDVKEPLSIEFGITPEYSNGMMTVFDVNGNLNISFDEIAISHNTRVEGEELPFELYSFHIGNDKYIVKMTQMKHYENEKRPCSDALYMYLLPEQEFIITDTNDNTVCYFSPNSYAVYSDKNVKELQEAVAYSLVMRFMTEDYWNVRYSDGFNVQSGRSIFD